jgi:hypothetical protein
LILTVNEVQRTTTESTLFACALKQIATLKMSCVFLRPFLYKKTVLSYYSTNTIIKEKNENHSRIYTFLLFYFFQNIPEKTIIFSTKKQHSHAARAIRNAAFSLFFIVFILIAKISSS